MLDSSFGYYKSNNVTPTDIYNILKNDKYSGRYALFVLKYYDSNQRNYGNTSKILDIDNFIKWYNNGSPLTDMYSISGYMVRAQLPDTDGGWTFTKVGYVYNNNTHYGNSLITRSGNFNYLTDCTLDIVII